MATFLGIPHGMRYCDVRGWYYPDLDDFDPKLRDAMERLFTALPRDETPDPADPEPLV